LSFVVEACTYGTKLRVTASGVYHSTVRITKSPSVKSKKKYY
jgi:hypothetical protein